MERKVDNMLKTRRFKALNGAKGKYSRIVNKIAIYDNNRNQIDCCVIHKDDNGREYYYPSNPHNKNGLFSDRPKDAIECIRNGFGDGFQQSHLFGMTLEHVVRYIDREYGEEIRQKTIKEWKDARFSYGVKFYFLNSFSRGKLVCKHKDLMGYGATIADVLTFDTEIEASAFIDEVNKKAKEYHEEYINLEKTGNRDEDYENIFKPFFNKIKRKMENGTNSVYWMAFSGLNKEDKNGRPEYKMEIVQVVLP